LHVSGVTVSGFALGRRSDSAVQRALEAARHAEPTYDHVGSTLGAAPAGVGVHHDRRIVVGELTAAAEALARWVPHTGIGGRVVPDGPAALGETICVVVPFGPVELCVPDRIVVVIDEPRRVGFAYGTLPGHPERGEELFLAETVEARRVRLSVTVHAVPASVPARVGAPITRWFQRAAASRYLDAWAQAVTDGTAGSR
jgi:uncharacterized protein (UPF0548 family)